MECNINVKPVNCVANIWDSAVVWFKKTPLQGVMMCKFYLFYNFKCVLLKIGDAQTLYMFNLSFIMSNVEMFLHFHIKNGKPFPHLSAK